MRNRLFLLFSLFLLLFLVPSRFSAAYGQTDKLNLPHFFPPGIVQTVNPADQWEFYLRYKLATEHCQGLPSDHGQFITAGKAFRQTVNIAGKNVGLILDPYVKNADGTITFTSYCGQEIVTEAQLKTTVDYIVKREAEAADLNWAFYHDVEQLAVKERAKKLGMPEKEFRAQLDKPSRYKNITVREEHLLMPELQKSDFVSRELHLGFFPKMLGQGILGAAWLNSGTAYVTMQSLVLDYLLVKPVVLMHESIHTNKKLQRLPLTQGFDAESFASIPEMFLDEDKIHLWFHGYIEFAREIAWVHFGFDFKQAKKEVVKIDLGGNLYIDRDKFNQYSVMLEKAKPFLRETMKKALVEFYSDAPGWVALNDKMGNDNVVFDIIFAKSFDFCIRVTETPGCKETMRWAEAHKEEIMAMAEKAFKESGSGGSSSSTLNEAAKLEAKFPKPLAKTVKTLFPDIKEEEIAIFLAKKGIPVNALLKMDSSVLTRLFNEFLTEQGGRK